jgi:hypothetical protein
MTPLASSRLWLTRAAGPPVSDAAWRAVGGSAGVAGWAVVGSKWSGGRLRGWRPVWHSAFCEFTQGYYEVSNSNLDSNLKLPKYNPNEISNKEPNCHTSRV